MILLWMLVTVWPAAQAAPVDSIMGYLQHAMLFSKVTPQEKVYLHFDNTGYFKGEHIWFKAYVTRAAATQEGDYLYVPTDISRVLYVELVNPAGDIIQSRKLPIADGEAHGDILLDSIIGTGFYEVRAFTRYMMNFGDGGVFSRVFPIFRAPEREGDYTHPVIDPARSHSRTPRRGKVTAANGTVQTSDGQEDDTAVTGKRGVSVHFYPEGGDLVEGLTSRVAFTVNDSERGELDRGVTEYTPTAAAQPFSYQDGEGKVRQADFPAAKAEGCVMRLDATDDESVRVTVSSSAALQGRLLAYVLMHNGGICECDTFTATAHYGKEFPKYSLPAGVNQLTVFDSHGQIQCERLFFIYPVDNASDSIVVKAETGELRSCGNVKVRLRTRAGAALSFSAMDAGTLTGGKQGNIHTWMLLSSDLKGYIDNPEYYFEADDRAHREAADLLMMVQGWRRYDWRLIEGAEQFPQPIQPVEDKLYVFGQLKPSLSKWKKKNPVGDVDLTAFLYNGHGQSLTGSTRTDSLGNYAFQLPDVNDEWNMQIQTKINDKLKSYTVCINRHFSPVSREYSPEEQQLIDVPEANLFKRPAELKGQDAKEQDPRFTYQVGKNRFVTRTVKIKRKRNYWTDYSGGWYNEQGARRKADLFYDCDAASDMVADMGEVQPTVYAWLEQHNSLFTGGNLVMDCVDQFISADTQDDSYVGDGDTLPGAFNMHTDGPRYDGRTTVWILNNKYAGVTGLNCGQKLGSSDSMEILRVAGQSHIERANNQPMPMYLDEVKSIYITEDPTVLTSYLMQSTIKSNNPVIIFVYTHPSYSTASNKGLRRTHFQGFNAPSTFEMDDYSILPPMNDFRRTLYWNPEVKTDAKGEAEVEFYNNSTAREIYVSVEGMTATGSYVSN